MKIGRREALFSLLGAPALMLTGCVSGSASGDGDYFKVCVERVPVPSPPRCEELTPQAVVESDSSDGWVYIPFRWDSSLQDFLDAAREGRVPDSSD